MTKRIVLAGILGGVAMFLWASVAHMVLPLGRAGIREIPGEQALLGDMHSALGESPGLYMFPGMGASSDMNQYEQKLTTNPSGLLIYHPPGAKALTPAQLATEFLTELLEALLLSWLIAQIRLEGRSPRFGYVIVVGLISAISTNVSYWNWYGFPTAYTLAYMTTQFVGYLAAGLVAIWILGRPVPKVAIAP
ncbi:MAG: hypothetical protein ABSH42_11530 [Bryobacteraceae bacterium]|jgi:hypothetical protein